MHNNAVSNITNITNQPYGSKTVYNRLPASIAWTNLSNQIKTIFMRA